VTPLAAPFDPDSVSAGPLGFLIVLLLLVVTVLLIRNMGGRIKRLPPEFPEDGRGLRKRQDDDPA
jgi:hypothetical protein